MVIKKITVENWRTVKSPLTLEFCGGINIICGDNGRGKSTVMEALRMGFFDRHNITGDEIRKIRPWGCELSPRVQIEFCRAGIDYRLTKRFIGQKSSLVERMDSSTGLYERFMESDGADAWLRGIMSGEAAARGISKQEHWGLAGLLWMPQGVNDYGGVSSALMKHAADRKSAQPEEARREGNIESAIRREYLKYFTDNGNARQGAGCLREQESNIMQKRTELNKRLRQLSEMAALRDEAGALQKQIAVLDAREENIRKRVREAEVKLAEYEKIKLEYDKIKPRLDAAESQKKLLERDIADLGEARSGINRSLKTIAYRQKELEEEEKRLKSADEQIAEKMAAWSELDSQIRLEFRAETDVEWEPVAGEPPGRRGVGKGEKAVIRGLGRVEVRLPSIGTVTVTGPVNDNAAALQERINTLKQQLETHMKTIESRKRDIDGCNETIERANEKISHILAGGRTEESLITEHRKMLGEIHVMKESISECKARVEKIGGNPHRVMEELKRESDANRAEQESKRKQAAGISGQLKAFGGMGLYEETGAMEEEIGRLAARFDAEALRARALKLVWDTMKTVRREFQDRVGTPVEKRASELFALVNGSRAGMVKLDGNFRVAGFIPETGPAQVETGSLSGGEQEQLYFCARLALAERIIGDNAGEKYALVFDDIMTATDNSRLSRLKDLLVSFEDRYQYLIFTCHGERYAGISGSDVRVIDL